MNLTNEQAAATKELLEAYLVTRIALIEGTYLDDERGIQLALTRSRAERMGREIGLSEEATTGILSEFDRISR